MAYEKQTWLTGEVITKEKLNHMEDGIANGDGGAFIANMDTETHTLDKTWNEIKAAFTNGQPSYVVSKDGEVDGMYPIVECINQPNLYKIEILIIDTSSVDFVTFSTSDPNGYPTFNQNTGN